MLQGSCPCGTVGFETEVQPLARFYCHCTTCQKMYQRPYVDLTVAWSWNVNINQNADSVEWVRKHKFPVSVHRGVCQECSKPVLGRLQVPTPGLSFIATANWSDRSTLPPPSGHIFYRSRVVEVDDPLPKVEGWLGSELAVPAWALPRMLGLGGNRA